MICLGIPPFPRGQNFCNNLSLPPLLINLFRHLPRNLLLFRIMVEDTGTVLGASVWALAIRGCRIMHFVKEFEELAVCYLGGVVGYLKGFGICISKLVSILLTVADRLRKEEDVRPVRPEQTAR